MLLLLLPLLPLALFSALRLRSYCRLRRFRNRLRAAIEEEFESRVEDRQRTVGEAVWAKIHQSNCALQKRLTDRVLRYDRHIQFLRDKYTAAATFDRLIPDDSTFIEWITQWLTFTDEGGQGATTEEGGTAGAASSDDSSSSVAAAAFLGGGSFDDEGEPVVDNSSSVAAFTNASLENRAMARRQRESALIQRLQNSRKRRFARIRNY